MDYIAAMEDYYTTVLSEETTDYNKAFIQGKLKILGDIRKKIKKLDKE